MSAGILLLLLLAALSRAAAGTGGVCAAVRYLQQNICPPEWQKQQMRSIKNTVSEEECLTQCSLQPSCAAVHVSVEQRTCWLADSKQQWSDHWAAGGQQSCASFLRDQASVPPELASGIIVWYNFRYSLTNQANSSSLTAQLVNAERNASGLQLAGGSSYAGVSMPQGLESFVGVGGQFSVFAKAERKIKSRSYFVRAANGVEGVVFFYEKDRKLRLGHRGVKANRYYDTAAILPNEKATVAVGYTCNGGCTAYFDGSLYSASEGSFTSPSGPGTDVQLGHRHGEDSNSLEGRMLCFGMWQRSLSLEELQRLDAEC